MWANRFSVLPDHHPLTDLTNDNDDVVHVEVHIEQIGDNEKRKCNPNMHSKGKKGERKRYFKQGYRRRKRKPTLNFDSGENVVFEAKSGQVGKTSLYVGRVKSMVDNDMYIVESIVNEGRQCTISYQDNPRLIKELIVDSNDVKEGVTVLVAWQIINGFPELVPAQIVEVVGSEYVWVQSVKGECVKVHVDNIIKITKKEQIMTCAINADKPHVSIEQLNVVRLMLSATKNELATINCTYQKTLQQLQNKITDCENLQNQKEELNELHLKAIETIEQYRNDLMESTKTSQTIETLHSIIKTQEKDLDSLSKKVISLEEELQTAREDYQMQTNEINRLKAANTNLHQMKDTTYKMTRNIGPTLQAQQIRNKTRPTTFLPIALPHHNNPSSKASRQTLRRRGEQLNEVLNVISARTNPTATDLIQTLAAFLRHHPDIAIPACKSAKIRFATEFDAKDAVDLKVLLRLPMTRMRDLRRFLSKRGVKLLPSDKHLYKEMSDRQYQADDMVEVGVMDLKKTTHAAETSIAFFRIRSLEDYIVSHIEKQMKMDNVRSHDNFNKEIWIKIGGDKGGTSTKLAFQYVNQHNSNSSAATNILAMFEACDTYSNMENVFGNFYTQLAELQRRKTLTINRVVYPLRIFYFGDTEFLCKTFGHMGPSSSYPCLWCKIQLKNLRNTNGQPHCPMTLKDNKWVKNDNWAESRTFEDYQQDLANLVAEEEDEGQNVRISGKDHHSISKRPLLPLPSDLLQIVPPSLHILLGLVVRHFKQIEDKCRQLDKGNVQGAEQLERSWNSNSQIAKQAELDLREAKDALEDELDILSSLQQAANGRVVRGLTNDACCMPLCKLRNCTPQEVDKKNVSWIRCIECGEGQTKGWFHSYCVGLSKEESESDDMDEFVCPICTNEVSGPNDVISLQEERVNAHKALVRDKEEDYSKKKKVLDATYDDVVERRGNFEKTLNDTLKKIGVQRQAYHSQCFVGNHCKIILANTEVLLDVLPNSDFKCNMIGLFKRLRAIFKLFKSDFLSDAEVRALCVRCWELGTWFPRKFPTDSIPPKMHMLVCHIPEFVQKWKTVGLLSEHGLESIHKDINSIERIYCTVRESQEKMRLVIGNHQQRSATNAAAIQVSPKEKKTCYTFEKTGCKGRYKLRFKGSEERVCGKCAHVISI
ncbi:uncharacterized protein [Amphiura filiformis]|uniref:uncharacterized protein n=1 Tax=Amphiura filiformis TaxID=82378 RepID=UPI003B228BA5